MAFTGDQVTAHILKSLIDFSETFVSKISILHSERLIKNNIENIENELIEKISVSQEWKMSAKS